MNTLPYRVRSVGHTGITVSDLDASIAFYRDVLGLFVGEKFRVEGPLFEAITGTPNAQIDIAFVQAPGHVIELLYYADPGDKKTSKLRAYDPGFLHVCLKITDIDKVVEAVAKAGFKAIGPVQTMPDGPVKDMRVVYVRDPDNVVLELIQEPPGLTLEKLYL